MKKIGDKNGVQELYNQGLSLADIAHHYGLTYAPVHRFFKRHNLKTRNVIEAHQISKKYQDLWFNMKGNTPWNKGLDISDPRVKQYCLKNKAAQIKNGKNKGSNNPMHGKVTKVKVGYREDLQMSFRSSWEANFARILKYLKISFLYEPETFSLIEGDTYTPDFYIPSKDAYYEIKGRITNDKHIRFSAQYNKRLVIVNEKFYKRLIKKYKNIVSFSDKIRTLGKKNLIDLYIRNGRTSVNKFLIKEKIHKRIFYSMFSSVSDFYKEVEEICVESSLLAEQVQD